MSGDARFQLDDALFGARSAIVHARDIGERSFSLGEACDLFLVRLTSWGNWICRIWSKNENPWLAGKLPEIEAEIAGRVAGFAENFRGIVDLAIVEMQVGGTTVEAAVHRRNLPDNHDRPIDETLQIGDGIRALVESIDIARLRINLDIQAWYIKRLEVANEENRKERLRERSASSVPQSTPIGDPPLVGLKILIVDDDSRLRSAMERWLVLLGAEVKIAASEAGVKNVFDVFQPTHVLLDYSLANDDFEPCARLLKTHRVPVAVFTGRPDRAWSRAAELGFGIIAKPATIDELRDWFINPRPAPANAPTEAPDRRRLGHWTYEARADWIADNARELIERMCERHDCVAALWLAELRPTVFELRAFAGELEGSSLSALMPRLGQSVVANTLAQGQATHGVLPPNDPLRSAIDTLALSSPHYMALPIIHEGMRSRVIVFIKNGSFRKSSLNHTNGDKDTFERIMFRKDHFELLIWATQQVEHIDQVEAFATQGRLASAAVHEAHNVLAGLMANSNRMKRWLEVRDWAATGSALAEVNEDLDRLGTILRDGLELIRADRRALTNVDRVVERVVARMRDIAVELLDKEYVTIIVEPSGQRVVTAVPPAALEQALFNLIENAIEFLPDVSWAQIRVVVRIGVTDQLTSIYVDVIDNGPGLTAEQESRLFEPRVTAKRKEGNGMGLYVSRNLLRMAAGDLCLCNTARWGGAHFQIRLPAVLGPMDDEAEK
jgi:signal transduction histidine kinase